MKVIRTELEDVLLAEPPVFEDARGTLYESFNRQAFLDATGVAVDVLQENRSRSKRNVLRGLHYQVGRPQGKLIQVLSGEIFDVAVDLRRASSTFRRWVGIRLDASGVRMAWIPPGFAHGFLALSDAVDVVYKLTEPRIPANERTLAWNDPDVGVRWPLAGTPILSAKDAAGAPFAEVEYYP